MCMFSGKVDRVSNTRIFARGANGRQYLVYGMAYKSKKELAMVLPLPVPQPCAEDEIEFYNMKDYPTFFTDMKKAFPTQITAYMSRSAGSKSLSERTLVVHEVGDYEASFVPGMSDFDRLDERFRIPQDIWQKLPDYQDYGFAVFKLKPTTAKTWAGNVSKSFKNNSQSFREVHPMAFTFPRRNPDMLYFPTIHVHKGNLPAEAFFDHTLFCQPDDTTKDYLDDWESSLGPLGQFLDVSKTRGIVDGEQFGWQLHLQGKYRNQDTWCGHNKSVPTRI